MIYYIGGPPKCGKTTLAKQLSKRLSVPWISADTLQNIARSYIPEKDHNRLFPRSCLRGENNDQCYAENTTEEIVQSYIQQGKTSYAALQMMAETYLTDEEDFIVEGYHVTPEIMHQIRAAYGQKHVRSIFLVRHDAERFIEDIPKSTTPNDWILRRTMDEQSTYPKIAKMIARYSEYFEAEATKYGLHVIATDRDFANKLEEAISLLTA